MTNRSLAVGGACQLRDIRLGAIVNGPNISFVQRDADQHRDDRLRHRKGRHALLGRAVVLIALDEDGVASEDEEARGAVARQEVVEIPGLGLVGVPDRGFGRGALQRPHLYAAIHLVRRKDFVEAAHHAHQTARLRAHLLRADWIGLGLAERELIGRGKRPRREEQASEKNQG